jgi:hypothetical protein
MRTAPLGLLCARTTAAPHRRKLVRTTPASILRIGVQSHRRTVIYLGSRGPGGPRPTRHFLRPIAAALFAERSPAKFFVWDDTMPPPKENRAICEKKDFSKRTHFPHGCGQKRRSLALKWLRLTRKSL